MDVLNGALPYPPSDYMNDSNPFYTPAPDYANANLYAPAPVHDPYSLQFDLSAFVGSFVPVDGGTASGSNDMPGQNCEWDVDMASLFGVASPLGEMHDTSLDYSVADPSFSDEYRLPALRPPSPPPTSPPNSTPCPIKPLQKRARKPEVDPQNIVTSSRSRAPSKRVLDTREAEESQRKKAKK
jgi:hypothetical protein